MEDSITTPFQKAPNAPASPPSDPKRRKPREISMLFLPIYLPLFLIAGALSIPWTYVLRLRQRRQERQFATLMESSGRIMTWKEFETAIENGQGTAIGEFLSMKGPFRLWWTREDIPAVSPHSCDRQHHLAFPEPEFAPFFDWCHAQFTNPRSGRAQLVIVPKEDRKGLKTKLEGARFVSICSFAMSHNKQNSKK
jgi:hypothetical protein